MMAATAVKTNNRIDNELGFILNSRPWKESSLIIDIFSQHFGRLALIARGCRKASSELRGVLNPFTLISFSWYGKHELLTLHRAKWIGGYPSPKNIALFSGLYINELVYKLLAPNDPHPKLFEVMQNTMKSLALNQDIETQLRQFEWVLLQELGFAPNLTLDNQNKPINRQQNYWIEHENNPILSDESRNDKLQFNSSSILVSGETLHNIHQHDYNSHITRIEAKKIMRFLIEFRVNKHKITCREILSQLDHFL